ncbi:MAG: metallophosphoesterase family protein [Gemmatimonadetes bacterium]|nr:metallophosphoesterase family protein [Gemmatimonadota bacterium]
MRIAALYDIHANLPALETAVAAVVREGAELIVIGGDVLPGPMPRETLAYLRSLAIPAAYLLGNGDREVLAVRAGEAPDAVPERFRPMMRWVAEQISDDQVRWIEQWPATLSMHLPALGHVLFCHATPHSDTELFTVASSDARSQRLFPLGTADVVVCGHTHMQFVRDFGRMRIINAGSVGMAVGIGGAEWLLIDDRAALRRAPYDRALAAARVRRTEYPLAEEFATSSVLSPPDSSTVLEALTRAVEGL